MRKNMNIEFKANRDIQKQQGYTLVELLVSLAVSAIVISVGFSPFFARGKSTCLPTDPHGRAFTCISTR